MAAARITKASDLQTRINFELRNTYKVQFTEPEILAYINKWLEFVHQYLIESDSDLVRIGKGTFQTEAGVELYSLSENGMGDLWVPYKIWVSTYQPMEMVPESERDPYVANQEAGVDDKSIPAMFYLEGDEIGLLPFPDDVHTVNLKYYPEYSPLISIDDAIPYRNLFNLQLEEGSKILAKNRENYGTAVDAALMDIFKERAKALVDLRQKKDEQFIPINPVGGYEG